MNRFIKSFRRKRALRLLSARCSVVSLAAAALLLFSAPPALANHSLTVTATGGLNAQAVLTVLFYNAGTDGGTYYVDWGDTQQSTSSLVFGNTTLTWNHTYAAAGTYNVQLFKDSAPDGSPQLVTVPPDTTAPIVSITIPAVDPSTVSSPIPVTVSGTATDPESGIAPFSVTWSNPNLPDGGLVNYTGPGWTVDVPISPGTNHIVISAINGVGLTGSDSVDVIYTPADTQNPVLTITFPPTDPYGTNSSSITVTGTASDNVGVDTVDWYNMTSEMSGAAAGTAAWSAGPISLYAGTNDILITASDAAGNSATDTVQVVYTSLDVQNPVVTITSPTSAATLETRSSPIPLAGTASDDVGVTGVVWANNRGGSGAAAGTSSWTVAAATLQPGVNIITVTASDASAKSGIDVLTVTYDNGAPSVQITAPTAAPAYTTNTTPLTLSGTASDTETSVDTVVWANAANGGSGAAAGTVSWTASGITLAAGTNIITVTATDQLGNQSVDQITVTYDNTDPTVAISAPTAAATYQTTAASIALSGTSSDTITSVAEVRWANDRGGSGTATGTTSWSVPSITLFTGVNIITITAEDEAGNTGTDVLTVTFDNIDPTVTITTPTAAATYSTASPAIPLGGTASDTGTTVASVTWVNDRGGSGTASGTTSWSVATVNLFSGANVITVTATDSLGNTGTDTLTVTYTPADVIDPVITITSPTSAPAYTAATTPISLGGTASDNTAVTQVLWANDRGGSGAAAGTNAWSIPSVNLSLGSNVITVTAWDAANNTAADTLTVDYSPPDLADPTVTIATPAADPYYTSAGSVVVSGTAGDDISLTQVRWTNDRGGSGTATGTTSWTATVTGLSEGTNVITITAEDWAAKTGTDTVTVVYDPTAPTVTIQSPTTGATYDTESATIDLTGTATDNLGVVQVLWSNDRGGSGAAAGTGSWSVSGIGLQTGQNVITISATDAVGNTGVDVLTVNPAEFSGPGFAGQFFIGRMELRFTVDDPKAPGVVFSPASPGQATVPRNHEGLGAEAVVIYNASGILQGKWLVDGQVLGTVSRMLYPGRSEAVIPFPDVPGLPTYDAGIHRVEFVIDSPSPAFDEPAISYFVSAEEAEPTLPLITLRRPADRGTLPMMPGTIRSPSFSWDGLGPGHTYRFTLSGPVRGGVGFTRPGGQVPFAVAADTSFPYYNLSMLDLGRLLPGVPYTWQITARRNGRDVARSGSWTFTFVPPDEPEGDVQLMSLTLTGGSGAVGAGQLDTSGEEEVGISVVVDNQTASPLTNRRVEFMVDDELSDSLFVSSLSAGDSEALASTWYVTDAFSHDVTVRLLSGPNPGDPVAADLSGYMAGEEGQDIDLPDEPPADGYWIGEFNLKDITPAPGATLANYGGSGIIDIPTMGQFEVDFTGLVINEAEGRVTQGTIVLTFDQWDFERDIDLGPITVTLDSIDFTPEEALCQGIAEIQTPVAPETLELTLGEVRMRPDGLAGPLGFDGIAPISLTGLLNGYTLQLDEGSSVVLNENVVVSSSLAGSVTVPADILHSDGGTVSVTFDGLTFAEDGGIYGPATLPEATVLDTTLMLSGGMIVDLTLEQSPDEETAEWMGLYVSDGTVLLPEPFETVTLDNVAGITMLGSGIYGDTSLENAQADEIDYGGGFIASFNSLHLDFAGMSFTGTVGGSVTVPKLNATFTFEVPLMVGNAAPTPLAVISDWSEYTFEGTENKDPIRIRVEEGGEVWLIQGVVTADLTCTQLALGKLGGSLDNGMTYRLLISSEGWVAMDSVDNPKPAPGEQYQPPPRLSSEWITPEYFYPVPWIGGDTVEFSSAFSVTIDMIGIGWKDEEGLLIAILGKMVVGNDLVSVDAGVGVWIPSGDVWVTEIVLEAGVPKAFHLRATLLWFEDNEFWGDGFRSTFELNVIDSFAVAAELMIGYKDDDQGRYLYWFVDSQVQLPVGINITPYIAIYGFMGGIGNNVALTMVEEEYTPVDEEGQTTGPPEMRVVPHYIPGRGYFNLKAGVTLGTGWDNGTTWNGDLSMEIALGEGVTVRIRGDSWLLCKRTMRTDARRVNSEIVLSTDPMMFSSRLWFDSFKLVTEDEEKTVVLLSGDIDMKIAEDDWHFYMGTKPQPSSVRILPGYVNIQAHGYFTVDGTGITAGFGMEVDTGRKRVLIFYGRLWGGFNSDFELQFQPAFVYAEMTVWMGIEAGIDVWVGKFQIFKAYADLNAGLRTPDPTRIWVRGTFEYSVCSGALSGRWSMSFSWGDPVPSNYEPEDIWPVVEAIDPEDNAGEVNIASPVVVYFTQPVGQENRLTFMDADGSEYYVEAYWDQIVVNQSAISLENGVSGQPILNEAGTQLTFVPFEYLNQHSTYYVHVLAHAAGSEQLLTGGRWDQEAMTSFTTGGFPADLKPLLKYSYPHNGQKYVYRASTIEAYFNRSLDILDSQFVTGQVLAEDGTWIEGEHRIGTPPPDRLSFVHATSPFEPGTRYIYKLLYGAQLPGAGGDGGEMEPMPGVMGTVESLTQQPGVAGVIDGEQEIGVQGDIIGTGSVLEPDGSEPENLHEREGGDITVMPENQDILTPEDWMNLMGETWLTIGFETSQYMTFSQMMNDSPIAQTLHVHPQCYYSRPEDGYPLDYTMHFATAEPMSLQDITFEPVLWNDNPLLPECQMEFTGIRSGIRTVTQSAEIGIIPRSTSEQENGTVAYGFDLEVMPGPYTVHPITGDLGDDIDAWNQGLNEGSIPVDYYCAKGLIDHLFDGMTLNMRHPTHWVQPYVMGIDLPDRVYCNAVDDDGDGKPDIDDVFYEPGGGDGDDSPDEPEIDPDVPDPDDPGGEGGGFTPPDDLPER